MINELRHEHKLSTLLQLADLSRSTFYYQRSVIAGEVRVDKLESKINEIYTKHKGRYGYRRITATLNSSLESPVNHKRVQRLMQKLGLHALIRAKRRYIPNVGVRDANIPNVLQRDFEATEPNQKWVTDVTEFNIGGQKLYLSACMDLYNGEVLAYKTARRPIYELVSETLKSALARAGSTLKLIVHSDQGWQYRMPPYMQMLKGKGITQSMSRRGNCLDNAAIESFFGTLKTEYFYLEKPKSIQQLETGIKNYMRYYNTKRIKLGLGSLSPVEYRLKNLGLNSIN
jgi:putative transposase